MPGADLRPRLPTDAGMPGDGEKIRRDRARHEGHDVLYRLEPHHLFQSALAPRVTRHGVLVEIYGEGILINGDSGIGKSETAIELVKRGHRLIADDAVEIKRSRRTSWSAPRPRF